MSIRIFLLLSLFAIFLFSCESECKLQPIPEKVFDLNKVQKVLILKSQNVIDSAIIVEKNDYYEKTSFKGPMNYRECEHYKSYEYKFRDDNILVSVRKNVVNSLELDLLAFGNCPNFNSERKIAEKELLLNKEYSFEKDFDCEQTNSNIKKVVLKGFLIESITTTDNKVWKIK